MVIGLQILVRLKVAGRCSVIQLGYFSRDHDDLYTHEENNVQVCLMAGDISCP